MNILIERLMPSLTSRTGVRVLAIVLFFFTLLA
jgi:hypothetical protein